MRLALYIGLLLAMVPFVLTRPFFGLCIYYIVSILQPKYLCWRPDVQDALIVGVPLVVGGILIGVRRLHAEPKINARSGRVVGINTRVTRSVLFEPAWQILMFVVLAAYLIINRFVSPFPMSPTGLQFNTLCKVMIVAALATGLASDTRRVRILYVVVALSAAFWAIKGGIKVVLLGPHQVYGKTYDNNVFALTSVMALPMVFYAGLAMKNGRWRTLMLIFSGFIILAVIGSRSRAGFLALVIVAALIAWSSRYRFRALFAVTLVGGIALWMSGDEVYTRVYSIMHYRQDQSAFGRFQTWNYALDLLGRYPLFGVGFNQFEHARQIFVGGSRAAHNIYLQNLAELGIIGHPIWLSIIIGALVSLFFMTRWCRRLPADYRWAYYAARGLMLAMLAFCIHGAFHNEEYFELTFAVISLSVALRYAILREVQQARWTMQAGVGVETKTSRRAHGNDVTPAATPRPPRRPQPLVAWHPARLA